MTDSRLDVRRALVIDVGGSWIRWTVRESNGTWSNDGKAPTPGYLMHPEASSEQLVEMMVNSLTSVYDRIAAALPPELRAVSVSFGGVIDAESGTIVGASPIWGSAQVPVDLRRILHERRSSVEWTIVNDLSAALLSQVDRFAGRTDGRLVVVNVGTGIAARTYDFETKRIPAHPNSGIQGEIGHIPVCFTIDRQAVDLVCDCGGLNHLNAFASGRGIESLSAVLERPPGVPVLRLATEPLARVLITALAMDPKIVIIVLVGGVIDAVGEEFRRELVAHMHRMDLYGIASDRSYFDELVVVEPESRVPPNLRGAALAMDLPKFDERRSFDLARSPAIQRHEGRWQVTLERHYTYSVSVNDAPLFDRDGSLVHFLADATSCLVVVDDGAAPHCKDAAQTYLHETYGSGALLQVRGGETAKQASVVRLLLDHFDQLPVDRRLTPIVAIGGGAVLDVVGFAASVYRRGVPYIRVPTTLLAMVDAGVGVKAGINYPSAKNRVGSFHPPLATIVDPTFLSTLSDREVSSGLAEAIKCGVAASSALVNHIESTLAEGGLAAVRRDRGLLECGIDVMLRTLTEDIWESSLYRSMDLGHLVSPQLEARSGHQISHGEAVSIDLAFSCVMAQQLGELAPSDVKRILALLVRAGLPIAHSLLTPALVESSLKEVRLHRGGRLRLPLPTRLGHVKFVDDVRESAALEALRLLATLQVDIA